MFLSLMILILSISFVCANLKNSFILHYFHHKKVPSVVGFSCNEVKDDFLMVKSFNEFGVTASIKKINNNYTIQEFAFTDHSKLGVFLDFQCCDDKQSLSSLFSNASEFRMFGELHFWLIIGSSSNVSQVSTVINDDSFGLSTNFVIAVPSVNNSDQTFDLYDVYNSWKTRGGKLNITLLGFWNEVKQLKLLLSSTKYQRRANMHGLILKTTLHHNIYRPQGMSLEDYLVTYTIPPKDTLSKFGFIINYYLMEMFNFTLYSTEATVWQPGDKLGPLIKSIVNKEVDMIGNPLLMNIKRTYLVKYLHQSWPFRTCFLLRSPQPKNIKINEILGPFMVEIWYTMSLYFLLSLFILALLFRYESTHNYMNEMTRYSNSFLVIIGAICQQSTNFNIDQASTRIAFFSIMISCLLIYNYYSCSVVSVRLNEPIIKMNDSLNELAKSGMKVASESMNYFEFLIKKPDWETQQFYENRWKYIPEAEQFMDPDKAILMVKEGGFAYHTHPEVGYPLVSQYYSNREICELTEVHLSRPNFAAFAVDQNSTFIEFFRIALTKISEVGVRQRQVVRLSSPKPECLKSILSASSIDIFEFAPHLLILAFGVLLGLFVFIIEKITINRQIYNEDSAPRIRKSFYTLN